MRFGSGLISSPSFQRMQQFPVIAALNERITRGDKESLSLYADARNAGKKNWPANTRHFAKVRSAAMFDNSAAQPAARAQAMRSAVISLRRCRCGLARFHFGTISHIRPQTVLRSRAGARC